MAQVTVESGNTLSGLAQQFGSSVDAIAAANNIANPDLIQVGQVLEIPDTPTSPSVNQTQVSPTIGAEELNVDQAPPVVPETPLAQAESLLNETINTEFTSESQKTTTALENTLLEISQQLEGRTADEIALEESVGIPEFNEELKGINDAIRQKVASLKQGLVDESGRVIPLGLLRGRQQQLKLQAGAEIDALTAAAESVRGNIELAQAKVDRAIKLKYEPMLAKFDTIERALTIAESRMSREQLAFAEKQRNLIQVQRDKIQQERDKQKEVMDALITVGDNGANPSAVATAMEKAQAGNYTLADARREFGGFTKSREQLLNERLLELKIDAERASINEAATEAEAEAAARLPAAQQKNTLISEILGNKEGLAASVGVTPLGRTPLGIKFKMTPGGVAPITPTISLGKKQKFLAQVNQLLSKETLDTLVDIKKQGATFGNLSNEERLEVKNAATALGGYAKYNDSGKVVALKGKEEDIIKEFERLQILAQRSIIKSGGTLEAGSILSTEMAQNYLDTIEKATQDNVYGAYTN